MIVIDIDMPKCWDDCRFNNGCECCLIDAVCTDETAGENGELPSFCPIKCDIENIKAEIRHNADRDIGGNLQDFISGYRCGMGEALEIIDKHTNNTK